MMMGMISRLWSMSLQAGILILVVLAVRFFLKKYPKIYMYFLWMLVGVRLLCPVFVEAPFSLQPEAIRPDGIVRNGEIPIRGEYVPERLLPDNQEAQADISGQENNLLGELPENTDSGIKSDENGVYPLTPENFNLSDGNHTSNHQNIITEFLQKISNLFAVNPETSDSTGILEILAMIYLSGAGIFFIFYTIQYLLMKHRVSTAVRGKQNVWFSDRIDSPFVLGIIRPRIIMPYGLKKQEGYQILRHEQTHIRHHDPLIRLIGTLCICLHWWNPLVWLAVLKMNQDMEMFCDESVLRNASPEEKKSYARTLLSFAEKRSGLSVGLAFGESHTERRVRNLARKKNGSIVVTGLVIILAVFCTAAFMTIPRIDAEEAGSSGTDNEGSSSIQASGGIDGAGSDIQAGDGTNSTENGGVQASGGTGSAESGGVIAGQSFDVEFNPHGQVTFAAYAPNTESNPGEDVAFKLIQDGQVLYTFGGNGIRQDKNIWKFHNVAAVSFPDINGDGYTDVITITNYIFDEGRPTEDALSEARIYTGRENGDFVEEGSLEEAYNNLHDQKTITDIQNFTAQPEYQDSFVRTTIYGKWKVTEHIPPAGIYALSDEEIESLEDIHLEYGRYWYYMDSQPYNYDVPAYSVGNYRKEAVSASQFEEDFRVDLGTMGLSVTEFEHFELEGVEDAAPLFGRYFYQIDADNALIYHEGVFFRAVRE
ncbi:MAG: hypothetical protein NC331_08130 [Lachnospiraceae bacterium]|nr:hypothetical protein [Lachnospiraceae bacterium]MCM1239339.1 hypothetical protein [Lachnospiraceae bacterium]